MHELGVTRKLIELIVRECKKTEIKSPKQVVLELGVLTTYTEESLRFYFDLMKKEESILRVTKLVVHKVPIHYSCKKCGKESIVRKICHFSCSGCGSNEINIIAGRELLLKSIEE